MRKSIGRILTAAALLVFGLSFAGCGKKEKAVERDPYKYVATFKDMDFTVENGYISAKAYDGDTVYAIVNQYDPEDYSKSGTFLRITNVATGETQTVHVGEIEGFENAYIYNIVKTPDGLTAMLSKWDETTMQEEYTFVSLDESGKTELLFSLTDIMKENEYVQNLIVDKEGNYVMNLGERIIKVSKDAAVKGEVSILGWTNVLFLDADNNVCISQYSDSAHGYEVRKLDFKSGSLGESLPFVISNGEVQVVNGKYLLISDDQVKEYDPVTGVTTDLWVWINIDTNYTQDISPITYGEDGSYNFMIMSYEEVGQKLEKVSVKKVEASQGDKKEIVIGCMYLDWDFRENVIKFNKSNDQYHITMKIYNDGTDYDAALTRFNTDIASGKAFDIVITDQFEGMKLAKKGAFADIGKLMAKDEEINRSDFFENILDTLQVNGKDYFFAPKTVLVTLVGPGKYFSNLTSWTPQDLIKLRNENLDKSFLEYPTQDVALSMLLSYNLSSFVDMDKGKCNFKTDEFKSVLEFVKTFPSDEEVGDVEFDSWNEIRKGNVFVDLIYMSEFSDVSIYNQLFPGGLEFIGIPTSEGVKHIGVTNEIYAICAKSPYEEGAWEFLKSLLDDELYTAYSYGGLPTYKKNFDAYTKSVLEMGDESHGSWGHGNEYIEIKNPSKEQIEKIRSIFESINGSVMIDSKIFEIIDEEVKPYLVGQKSVDEVADILQSRIGIYLAENG